jgi:AraC-like DNA-binding protein/mannose-6-phosphate isomerase-like protein (cupin superfamily)
MDVQREVINLAKGDTFRLLRWSRSVTQVEVIQAPERSVPILGQGDHWHYHPASELTFIARGRGTRLVADHIDSFDAGDLVLIGPNVPHYWHIQGVSAGLAVQWDLPFDHGIWSFAESGPLRGLTEFSRRGLHIHGRTAELTRQRMENLARCGGLDRLAGFLQILAGLVAAPRSDFTPLSAQAFSLAGSAETQEAIRRAVSYILASYRGSVTLPDLLRLTGMSRATFARQFLLHVGKSFSAFRNQVRLQAVCQALRDTTEPVGTIALNEGFNQLSFFNRLFRREFGVSPSEYRERLRRRGP